MSRNIYEPSNERSIGANRVDIKRTRQRPGAFRWWTPECVAGGDCTGEEPPLENSFDQPTLGSGLERWAFRINADGSLQFKGALDVSGGASSGTVAVTLPGANSGEADFLNLDISRDQSYATYVTTTGAVGGVTEARAAVDSSTGEVTISWGGLNFPWVRRKRGSSLDGGTEPATTFTAGGDTNLTYDDGGDPDHDSIAGSTDWESYFELVNNFQTRVLQDGYYLIKGNIHWDDIDEAKTFLVTLHGGGLWSEGWTITGDPTWESPSHMWQTWKRMIANNLLFVKVQFSGATDEDASSWYKEITRLGPFTGPLTAPDGIADE